MDRSIEWKDGGFLLVCILLGVLADQSFFHHQVGVSYIIFLFGFYTVFFIRFRKYIFGQRRMGMLVMFVIWILAVHYLLYDNELFKFLNMLVIPALVVAHIVLITKPKHIRWHTPMFIVRIANTIGEAFPYNSEFTKAIYKKIFKNMSKEKSDIMKKVLLGLLIGIPLLLVIIGLLMQADQAFQQLLGDVPQWLGRLQADVIIIRLFIILSIGWLFFGIFQVLTRNRGEKEQVKNTSDKEKFDGIVSLTVLSLLNIVYILFTIVQFTYFFGGDLQGGMSYAEYARRGFFELLTVTLVNLSTLVLMININKPQSKKLEAVLKSMYSLLIILSGVLLVSAFQRLALYEAHYGYTMDRVLPHVFMVYLFIIFIYTFIKVWMDRLSLVHFYIISGLLFYTGLNAVNIEKWVVERNLERFEETEKVDIDYLNSMSYSGVNGLLELYEQQPDYPRLESILENREEQWVNQSAEYQNSWQSYNVMKQKVIDRLENW